MIWIDRKDFVGWMKDEDFLREQLDDFPIEKFIIDFNKLDINFIREMTQYIDIKGVLWNAKPWRIGETIEEHMNRCYEEHLKEFWKDILKDKKYVGKDKER